MMGSSEMVRERGLSLLIHQGGGKEASDSHFRPKLGYKKGWDLLEESSNTNEKTLKREHDTDSSQEVIGQDRRIVNMKLRKITDENTRLKRALEGYKNNIIQKDINVPSEAQKVSRLEDELNAKEHMIRMLDGKIRRMEEYGEKDKFQIIRELERKLAEKEKYCLEKDNEKIKLMKELQSLAKDNKDGIVLCKKLESICSEFENAWTNEKEKRKTTENELKETKSKVKYYEEELEKSKGCSEDIFRREDEESAINERLRNMNSKLEKDKEQMKIKIERLNNNLVALSESRAIYLDKSELLEMKIKELEEEVTEKEVQIEGMKNKMLSEEKRSNNRIEENRKLQATLLAVSEELEKITKKCDGYLREIDKLQKSEGKSREKETELLNVLQERQNFIVELENEARQVQHKMNQKDDEISRLSLEIHKSVKNMNKIEGEREKIKEYCRKLEIMESSIKSEIEQKAVKLKEVLSKLKEEVQTNYSLTEDNNELQKKIARKDKEIEKMKECIDQLSASYQFTKSKLEELETTENDKDEELRAEEEVKNVLKSDNYRLQQEQVIMTQKIERNLAITNEFKRQNDELKKAKRELEEKLRNFEDEIRRDQPELKLEGNIRIQENNNAMNSVQKSWEEMQDKIEKLEQIVEKQSLELNKRSESLFTISKLELQNQEFINSRRISEERCRELNNNLNNMYTEVKILKGEKEKLLNVNGFLEKQIENLEFWLTEYTSKLAEKDLEKKKVESNKSEMLGTQTESGKWRQSVDNVQNFSSSIIKRKDNAIEQIRKYQDKEGAKAQAEVVLKSETNWNKKFERDFQIATGNTELDEIKSLENWKKWIDNRKMLYCEEKEKAVKLRNDLHKAKHGTKNESISGNQSAEGFTSRGPTMKNEVLQLKNKLHKSELADNDMEYKIARLCKVTENLHWRISELTLKGEAKKDK